MRFSENFKTLRKNMGLTQKEISEKLGVALSTIAMWETDNRHPDIKKLEKIAEFFNVGVEVFFCEDDELPDRFLSSKEMPSRVTPAIRHTNEDIAEIREMLRVRPEMKMLFSASKNASKEDIEQTVAIIEALKAQKNK